jgi:hypothetical protein
MAAGSFALGCGGTSGESGLCSVGRAAARRPGRTVPGLGVSRTARDDYAKPTRRTWRAFPSPLTPLEATAVPKSRIRRKSVYTPPPASSAGDVPKRWIAPVMLAMFLIGLAYIVVYYLAGQNIAFMEPLGNWNILIGFAFIGVGFGLATRWK